MGEGVPRASWPGHLVFRRVHSGGDVVGDLHNFLVVLHISFLVGHSIVLHVGSDHRDLLVLSVVDGVWDEHRLFSVLCV